MCPIKKEIVETQPQADEVEYLVFKAFMSTIFTNPLTRKREVSRKSVNVRKITSDLNLLRDELKLEHGFDTVSLHYKEIPIQKAIITLIEHKT